MLDILGLLGGIFLVIFLTWKNWHMTVVALLGSLVIVIFNKMNMFDTLSLRYLPALADFAEKWFLQFSLGAIFGEIMGKSGAAFGIANSLLKIFGKKSAILIVMLAGLILSYGGIGTFIIAFSIYPIAAALFQNADIPKKLIVATIMVCPVTVCMAMLPGSPSAQNMIPTNYFGTTIYAAPKIGIISSIFTFILAFMYLNMQVKMAYKKSQHFEASNGENIISLDEIAQSNVPPTWKCYIPIVVLLTSIFIMQLVYQISTIFSVASSMAIAILVGSIVFNKYIQIKGTVNNGAINGVTALISTSSIMGFGAVVSASPAYQSILSALMSMNINPLASAVVSINIIAAITGSSAGGLNIFLSNMSEYLKASGLDLSMLHRVTCIASSGFDSMPHASGIVVCNQIARTSQKDTYKHVFITCAIIPFCCTILAAFLGCLGIV